MVAVNFGDISGSFSTWIPITVCSVLSFAFKCLQSALNACLSASSVAVQCAESTQTSFPEGAFFALETLRIGLYPGRGVVHRAVLHVPNHNRHNFTSYRRAKEINVSTLEKLNLPSSGSTSSQYTGNSPVLPWVN